ncbi:hypothetical protein Goklo_014088, partial [Gossypium klotzschianum]|nr:hypothetical protein [Gossypium klotzschianum]
MDRVRELASKKAAVIFTKSSCCMCYSIKTLFYELGASPAIHELDQDPYGRDMERALRALGCDPSVPAVFIGGRFVGSSKDVISLHVDGSLKQMLKDAKAICMKKENPVPFPLSSSTCDHSPFTGSLAHVMALPKTAAAGAMHEV